MLDLDELVRDGLTDAATVVSVDVDDTFERVTARVRTGFAARRITRQATVCVVVLSLFVGVAIALSWQAMPERYGSSATVRVTAPSTSRGVPLDIADPVAVANETRQVLLRRSRAHARGIELAVARRAPELIELSSTGRAPTDADAALRSWTRRITRERKRDGRRAIIRAQEALVTRVRELQDELMAVDTKLEQLDPVHFRDVRAWDSPNGDREGLQAPPPVPETGTENLLNLAYERIAIRNELGELAEASAQYRIAQVVGSGITTKVVALQPAHRVDDGLPPATAPASAVWLVGVALIAGGGLALYRVRRRPVPRRVR